jgi:hypothetical protein
MTDYPDLVAKLHLLRGIPWACESVIAIDTLVAERDKLIEQNKTLLDSALLAAQERDAALADARRFVWWVSDTKKSGWYVNDYLQGVREGWSVNQWRNWTDKAMKESGNETA